MSTGKPFNGFRWETTRFGDQESVMVLSEKDESPVYHHWEHGKYNARCACCWYGFTHSAELHAEKMKGGVKR